MPPSLYYLESIGIYWNVWRKSLWEMESMHRFPLIPIDSTLLRPGEKLETGQNTAKGD